MSCIVYQRVCLFLILLLPAQTGLGQAESASRLDDYSQYAISQPGSAARGKLLFSDQRTRCNICHRVNQQGGDVGPDLSTIGGKFDRPHLIESLLEPSRQIGEGFRSTIVVTTDGELINGILKLQTDQHLVLMDFDGKRREIAHDSVEQIREAEKSLMPEDLANVVSKVEFVDLIAYLETLRSGNGKFGSAIAGPMTVPDGFEVHPVVTGLTGVTAMEVLSDGRILICEQTGSLRVVKEGQLLEQPMLELEVDRNWERGLIGVTVDPLFPARPDIYVCYVARDPYPHHRISRFRVEGDQAIEDTEAILLQGDDQSKLGGNVPAGHQGGAIHFGIDGRLYIGIGEQTAGLPAQQLDTFQGKILRLNSDGSIPRDNPLLDRTQGKYQAIWAYGCRNPFTFAVNPSNGMILINDVGGNFEEINRGVPGANYGWPTVEHGVHDREDFESAIHQYPQASIAGGDFVPVDGTSRWQSEFGGRYFFADFNHGWIKTVDPAQPESAKAFAANFRRPVDLRFGHDDSLYVLLRNAWVIDGKFQDQTGSLVRIRPTK